MFEFNSLAHRYYLEDLERAARHDIAERIHRDRVGFNWMPFSNLMKLLGKAFSPFGSSKHSSQMTERL